MTSEPPHPDQQPMQWSDQYLLGYTPIDEVHEEFVGLLGQLQAADEAALPALLSEFTRHLEQHFEMENAWMTESDFPPRDCHMDEHAAVLGSVHEIGALLSRGEIDAEVVRDLVEHLADWFPKHADQLDSALAHWMAKKRLGGKPVVLRRGLQLR
jgi:hemerythrin-like metal-binding protein